jgi:hypothetical protein
VRLDHDEARALRAAALPEIRARRRRQAAHAALNEHVRGNAGTLREGLVGDEAVTLHHVARRLEAAVRGRIGDHVPALRRGVRRSLAHGVVERAGEAAHLRAINLDRAGAARTDHVRHVDDAGAAEGAGTPGHRAAVIAVGRAGDGHAGGKIGAAAGGEIARGDGDLLRREDVPLQDLEHSIRAAQRLEAENAETLGFVLVEDLAQPRAGGEPGEPAQRGRIVAGP